LFDVDGFVDESTNFVDQNVFVSNHVGENAAEVLGKVLPPGNAVSGLARSRLRGLKKLIVRKQNKPELLKLESA
jgi:hypothetical protein